MQRDSVPLRSDVDLQSVLGEVVTFALRNSADFVFEHSYVLSNVIMMVWSIVYHSWLTFIFLLIANLLWIIPNQRRNMHNLSPIMVIYAEFLLISQYLYCMDLTEDELPTNIEGSRFNLTQVGFIRYRQNPCAPLLLKTLFTITFLMTLRQTYYEEAQLLDDLTAPFFGRSQMGSKLKPNLKKSKLVSKAGTLFKSMLMEVWIWIVTFALFLYAIYNERMTVFRIIYMALFLTFMITFHVNVNYLRKSFGHRIYLI